MWRSCGVRSLPPSDASVDQRRYFAVTVEHGRIMRVRMFSDRSDALEAVGLGEKAVSANLDLVRSIYADWERGDFSRADCADPEIEYTLADGPHPGIWIGHMPEGFRDWTSAWEGYRTEVDEYRELDAERVLVLVRNSGRGKRSGIELSQVQPHGAMVLHIRDGKVTRLFAYFDRDHALADLGLEE
jgi:ketosteroid isomerase-like protein